MTKVRFRGGRRREDKRMGCSEESEQEEVGKREEGRKEEKKIKSDFVVDLPIQQALAGFLFVCFVWVVFVFVFVCFCFCGFLDSQSKVVGERGKERKGRRKKRNKKAL